MPATAKKLVPALALLLAVALMPGVSPAGFIIRDQDYAADDPGLKTSSTAFIQKNRMRFQEENDFIYYLWNVESGQVFQVNTESKTYAGGTFQEEVAGIKKYLEKIRQELAEEMAEYGDEEMEEAPAAAPRPAGKVAIARTGQEESIAGYKAVKYEVRRGNELLEEVWVSRELDVSSDLDYRKFRKMFQEWMRAMTDAAIMPGEESSGPEWLDSEEYLKIFEEGYVLRQVEYLEGTAFINEVTAVEKKDIPEADLAVPQGYRKVTVEEFMEMSE